MIVDKNEPLDLSIYVRAFLEYGERSKELAVMTERSRLLKVIVKNAFPDIKGLIGIAGIIAFDPDEFHTKERLTEYLKPYVPV